MIEIEEIKKAKDFAERMATKRRKKLEEGENLTKEERKEISNDIYLLEKVIRVANFGLTAWKEANGIEKEELLKNIERLQSELQMEREEAAKALEKAKKWRERQIKELTDRKEQEKTEAIRKLEGEKQEKINQLNTKIRELEQAKEQIRNQVLQERKEVENKLRNKINGELENRVFGPKEKGKDLEEATDNLLKKQGKLENEIFNLKRDIKQKSQQLTEEKENHANEKLQLKNRIDKIIGDKNAWFNYESESLDVAIDKLFGNHQIYVESTGDKCVRVVTAPFKWTAGKIGTGFALAGFMAAIPAICGAIGWGLKAFLAVKTGGVGGAVMVANGMINHHQNNQGGNLPPNYQPLPQGNNNVNNQLLPAGENSQEKAITVHNHYHNSAEEKRENNWKRRKKKNKG